MGSCSSTGESCTCSTTNNGMDDPNSVYCPTCCSGSQCLPSDGGTDANDCSLTYAQTLLQNDPTHNGNVGYTDCTCAATSEETKVSNFHIPETHLGDSHQSESRLSNGWWASCSDNDVGLIAFAAEKGFEGANGCRDAIGYCSEAEVVDLCPGTCAIQSGCSEKMIQSKDSMWTEAIGSNMNPGEIVVIGLAVVGSITIVAKLFTNCTRKAEYNTVPGEKNSQEL